LFFVNNCVGNSDRREAEIEWSTFGIFWGGPKDTRSAQGSRTKHLCPSTVKKVATAVTKHSVRQKEAERNIRKSQQANACWLFSSLSVHCFAQGICFVNL